MKKVIVAPFYKAIVTKDEKFMELLSEGTYWFWSNEKITLYHISQPIPAGINLLVLLKYPPVKNALEVVEVNDNEMVLLFENKIFKSVLTTGIHAFWKEWNDFSFTRIDLSNYEISDEISRTLLTKTALVNYVRVFNVEPFEQALMFVNGKYIKNLEAGPHYFWKNTSTIEVKKVDTRIQQMEISGQEILTKDKAAIRVNFYTQYKVTHAQKAITECKDYEKQLYTLIQLALREYIGGFTLDELLEKKDTISVSINGSIAKKAEDLGVALFNNGIRDIILPGDMKEIMNQVLVAEKRAQANTIMRREETASTRSLLNTAKLMEENDMLWRLKEMEYIEKIADKITGISVSGGGHLIEQLKGIFIPEKK